MGGRKRGGNIDVQEKPRLVASHTPPTRDLAGNPGMCLDWESNQQPFSLQAGTQSTTPHWLGLRSLSLMVALGITIYILQFSWST